MNRLDEIIVFHNLEEVHIKEIVDIMIKDLEKRMQKMDINIKVTESTKEHISSIGFDPVYGARPLERTIRRMIEYQLAEEILRGNISKNDSIIIDYDKDNDKLIFKSA